MSHLHSNALNQPGTPGPQTYPVATPEPREFLRCRRCLLVQFRTRSGLCRRCGVALPPPPKLEFDAVSQSLLVLSNRIDSAAAPQIGSLCETAFSRFSNGVGPHLGRKIRRLRRQQALTQDDLASRAGVPRTYLSRIENGRVLPGPTIVQHLAGALGAEVFDLLANGRGLGQSELTTTPLWEDLLRYFSRLQPEQMASVIRSVRQMAGGNGDGRS